MVTGWAPRRLVAVRARVRFQHRYPGHQPGAKSPAEVRAGPKRNRDNGTYDTTRPRRRAPTGAGQTAVVNTYPSNAVQTVVARTTVCAGAIFGRYWAHQLLCPRPTANGGHGEDKSQWKKRPGPVLRMRVRHCVPSSRGGVVKTAHMAKSSFTNSQVLQPIRFQMGFSILPWREDVPATNECVERFGGELLGFSGQSATASV